MSPFPPLKSPSRPSVPREIAVESTRPSNDDRSHKSDALTSPSIVADEQPIDTNNNKNINNDEATFIEDEYINFILSKLYEKKMQLENVIEEVDLKIDTIKAEIWVSITSLKAVEAAKLLNNSQELCSDIMHQRFGLLHYAFTCKSGILKESIDRNRSHLDRMTNHQLNPAKEELILTNERIKDLEGFIRYTIQWKREMERNDHNDDVEQNKQPSM